MPTATAEPVAKRPRGRPRKRDAIADIFNLTDAPEPRPAPLLGRATSESGERNPAPEEPQSYSERRDAAVEVSRGEAVKIMQEIGAEFVKLRQEGRSGAWAHLEDRIMQSGHVLVSAGLISPKDWLGMSVEIEGFRKSEGGTQIAPGDFLAQWLSEDDKPKKAKVNNEQRANRKSMSRN